jgi:hypothetical protein
MTYTVKTIFLADRIFYNRNMIHFIKMIQQEGLPDYKAGRQLEDENLAATKRNGYIFSAMLLPSMASAAERFDKMQCYYRMLPAAARVMEFYKTKGSLPESLSRIGINIKDHKNADFGFKGGKFISPYNKYLELDGFMIYITDERKPDKVDISLVVEMGPRRKLPEPEAETLEDLL